MRSGLARLLSLVLLAVLGCVERVDPPALTPLHSPAARWEQVLLRATEQGGVDWALIARERETLDEMLAWIASNGPESRRMPESREDERLSALLNAHNVVMVDAILRFVWREGADTTLLTVPRAALRRERAFRVDSDWISLDRLVVHRILASAQDPEVLGAVYLGTADGPRLRFWRPETLRAVLKLGLNDWLERDGGMRREGDGWAVTADLMRYESEFRDWDGAPNLCMGLYEYTTGALQRWLFEHIEDCDLKTFEPEDRLDGLTRVKP